MSKRLLSQTLIVQTNVNLLVCFAYIHNYVSVFFSIFILLNFSLFVFLLQNRPLTHFLGSTIFFSALCMCFPEALILNQIFIPKSWSQPSHNWFETNSYRHLPPSSLVPHYTGSQAGRGYHTESRYLCGPAVGSISLSLWAALALTQP